MQFCIPNDAPATGKKLVNFDRSHLAVNQRSRRGCSALTPEAFQAYRSGL
jgi:hypothetical protein